MREQKKYNTAIYCRLSKDDDTRVGESSSITSQKEMLEKYVIENGWIIYDYIGIHLTDVHTRCSI